MSRGKQLATKLKEDAQKVAVVKLAELIATEKMRKQHLKDFGLTNIEISGLSVLDQCKWPK